jgi:hypothetical protein
MYLSLRSSALHLGILIIVPLDIFKITLTSLRGVRGVCLAIRGLGA